MAGDNKPKNTDNNNEQQQHCNFLRTTAHNVGAFLSNGYEKAKNCLTRKDAKVVAKETPAPSTSPKP